MNFLSLFVLIPLLMMLGLWIARDMKQIRTVAVIGSTILLALSVYTLVEFLAERAAGNTATMLFTDSRMWYAPLNIHYAVGVDGVSVAMLLLSSIIVFAGVFASWKINPLPKEYFLWFMLLSTGVFGFFISVDLFTMFMFYEVALIPMYLLIGVWGSGRKNYSAMKLTLMLMGGSALLMIGILGIYYQSGLHSMNVVEIAEHGNELAILLVPDDFRGIRCVGGYVPVPHMVARWSRFGSYGSVYVACRRIDEIRRIRLFPCSHLSDASGCDRIGLDILNTYRY